MIDLEKLIDDVRILRKRGLSYSEIARKLQADGVNVSRVTVMRWCKGLHDPRNRLNSVKLEPSPELAYVIGVMFGDGSVSFRKSGRSYKYRIRLKVVDREFAEEFKRCLEALGLKPSIRLERDRSRCDRWCVEVNSKILYEFLSQPKEKLFEVVEKFPAEFLRGFFDSEGCVYWHERRKRLMITAGNYDLELLQFVQRILASLNIHSKIYLQAYEGKSVRIRNEYYEYKQNFYRLEIYRRSALAEFAKNVRLSILRKAEKLKNGLRHLGYL